MSVSGCASVQPGEISVSAEYLVKNNNSQHTSTKLSDAMCEVFVGGNKYSLITPASLKVTPDKNDKLYVYCKKPGYTMVESYGYIQLPESLAGSKMHDIRCNATSIAMLGIPFVGVPLALIFQEPALLLTSMVGGAFIFGWESIRHIPYPKGYGYRSRSITVQMMPDSQISPADKVVIYNPQAVAKKNNPAPCPN